MATTESPRARDERAVVGEIVEALVDRRRRIASLQAEEAVLLHAAQEHALAQRNAACADPMLRTTSRSGRSPPRSARRHGSPIARSSRGWMRPRRS
jgi:hypothetical protein